MSKQKQIINRIKTLVKEYKSLNEDYASRTVALIADLTGTNKKFIQGFIDKHNLDVEKLYQYLKKGKYTERMDFVTAVAGKDGNPIQKKIIKMFSESVNESQITITKQDMDRLHSGEEVDIDGHVLKFVDESVNEAKELKWQDAETGDMANVKSINKTGLIIKAYGRKFHLQFADGSTKTYDANDLTFIKNESVNESWVDDYGKAVQKARGGYQTRMSSGNYSVMIGKTLDGFFGTLLVNTRGGKMGTATGIRYNNKSRDKVVKWAEKELKKVSKEPIVNESVNEDEQLDEKLITFSNRAPYGQVVFMAGGAGSGKGFAISNFIDSAGFKVRDVDEMKKQVGKLEQIGKINIDSWYKKYSGNLSPDAREHVEKYVINKGLSISDIAGDLRNPNNVASLHFIVDAMGIKEKWLINMLSGKNNPETLPNLIFDITAKNIKSITKTIPALISQGYKPQNIHLIWVLTNYHIAVKQNKSRARIVPDDIMLLSHEGAAKTIWSIVNGALPKGLNGRIDVILGGAKNTVMYTDSNGNELKGAVKGFTTLPVKKQGGGILPEKQWLDILYKWVSDNAPKTISLQKPLDLQMENVNTFDEFLNEGTGIHSKVRHWRNSNIKKPSGVKDLETMLDYLVNQGKLTGEEAKTLSHYSYKEVSDAVKDFYLNQRGDAFFRRYYMK